MRGCGSTGCGSIGFRTSVARTLALAALVAAAAASCGAQIEGFGGSPGSLYVPSGSLADLARDLRASALGDVVTIIVNENTSAVTSGVTNTARKSTAAASITGLAGVPAKVSALSNLLNSSNAQQLQGSGQTTRTSTLTTTMSVRVVDVTANGSLVVEGTKDLAVNSERQSVMVRGLIRPVDLTTANTVLSTQVANLEVRVSGKGVVNDSIKRPFFLYRILLGLLPF
ncbi:MAG TPA: flagellar basal body L-ring protein FlgH [Bryobacteraceae bacterium]|nr:flagellar basal body L-ring protein FlgH [Bryobacteraceae bacterium]